MELTLIFIKHHFNSIWRIIEYVNSQLFFLFYNASLEKVFKNVIHEFSKQSYVYRKLHISDAGSLYDLINSQGEVDLKYFKPHGFDKKSILNQFSNRSLLMLGTFDGEKLVGYFFLRFFALKKPIELNLNGFLFDLRGF